MFRLGLFQKTVVRRMATTKHAQPPKPTKGIKLLMQKYGKSALGVYLGLSIIDIPLCFLVVHSAGEDKIRELQDQVKGWFGYGPKAVDNGNHGVDVGTDADSERVGTLETIEAGETAKSSTLVTEFALAYAIHKSLIFIRLPITAAITPIVVKRLRALGFAVGKL